MYKEAVRKQSLGTDINKGIIWFIPKLQDPKLITSWRLITLLNVSYKILAKALAMHLKHILPKIICPKQTSFFRGRFILDNIITI